MAWAARRDGGSWYAPAAFFASFWTIFGGLPLIASPVAIAPVGMLFVAASCAAVLLGAWLARKRRHASERAHLDLVEPPYLGWAIATCTVLGLVVVALILYSVQTSSSALRLLSFNAIVQTIHKLSVARNAGTWDEPVAARILLTATYLGPMLGGVMLAMRPSGSSRWWCLLLALLPALLVTVILTTKSSLMLPLALAASTYLATSIAAGRPPVVTWRRAAWAAGAVAIIAIGFFLIQMARYAGWAEGRPTAVLQTLWSDTFPYLGVFSIWLEHNGVSASLHPTFGQYTFAGIFDLLHVHTRIAGLYTEQVTVNGAGYNIYTLFRGVVQDFTIPGALAFFVLVGFGAELVYRRVKAGGIALAGVLAAFYAVTLWSFVVDVFIYNTIVLAFVVLIGYLFLAPRLKVGQLSVYAAPGKYAS